MAKKKDDLTHGAPGFDLYYSKEYGERWTALKESLAQESSPVSYCVDKECRTYFLDSASILAAGCLPLSGAKNILDMCAAPGGKTLVLASLMDQDAELLSNERSFDRKQRLVKVCDEHLPQSIRERIKISCQDAAVMCTKNGEIFDAILLDAPCSSERHVLADPKYLDQWTPARIKTLAMTQWSILSSGWRMLKPGGYMVYSTCALANAENDGVIERLLKKFDNASVIQDFTFNENIRKFTDSKLPVPVKTKYGNVVLPDVNDNCGPIYFCVIHKVDK